MCAALAAMFVAASNTSAFALEGKVTFDASDNPMHGVVFDCTKLPSRKAKARTANRTAADDFKFVMTSEYLVGYTRDILPLEEQEKSKTDARLAKRIRAQATRLGSIDTDQLWRLYKLRVEENNFQGADNCLTLLRSIASQSEVSDEIRRRLDHEAEQLMRPAAMKRIEKSKWFLARKKYSEAYHELEMAELYFKDRPEEKPVIAQISMQLKKLEQLMPPDSIDVLERKKRTMQK